MTSHWRRMDCQWFHLHAAFSPCSWTTGKPYEFATRGKGHCIRSWNTRSCGNVDFIHVLDATLNMGCNIYLNGINCIQRLVLKSTPPTICESHVTNALIVSATGGPVKIKHWFLLWKCLSYNQHVAHELLDFPTASVSLVRPPLTLSWDTHQRYVRLSVSWITQMWSTGSWNCYDIPFSFCQGRVLHACQALFK